MEDTGLQTTKAPDLCCFPYIQHWWGHTCSVGSSSGLPSKRNRYILKRIHWRIFTTKVLKGLEHLSCKKRLRELGLSSLEKPQGVSSMYVNTWREGAKKTEPGSFQWCPVPGPVAMGTNWNTGGSLWTSGNTFSLWGWSSTGTSCPERLWNFPPWRYSKAVWRRRQFTDSGLPL